ADGGAGVVAELAGIRPREGVALEDRVGRVVGHRGAGSPPSPGAPAAASVRPRRRRHHHGHTANPATPTTPAAVAARPRYSAVVVEDSSRTSRLVGTTTPKVRVRPPRPLAPPA